MATNINDIQSIETIKNFNYTALANLGQRFSNKGDNVQSQFFSIYELCDPNKLSNPYCIGVYYPDNGGIIKIYGSNLIGNKLDFSLYLDVIKLTDIKEDDENHFKKKVLCEFFKQIYVRIEKFENKDDKLIVFPVKLPNNSPNQKLSFSVLTNASDSEKIYNVNNIHVIWSKDIEENYYSNVDSDFWEINSIYVEAGSDVNILDDFFITSNFHEEDGVPVIDEDEPFLYNSVRAPYIDNYDGCWVINGQKTKILGKGLDAGQPIFLIISNKTEGDYEKIVWNDKVNNVISGPTFLNDIKIQGFNESSLNIETGKIRELCIPGIDETKKSDAIDILKNSILCVIVDGNKIQFNEESNKTYKDVYDIESVSIFLKFTESDKKGKCGFEIIPDPFSQEDENFAMNLNRLVNVTGYVDNRLKNFDPDTDLFRFYHLNFWGTKTDLKNNDYHIADDESEEKFFNIKLLNNDEFTKEYFEDKKVQYNNSFNMIFEISDRLKNLRHGNDPETDVEQSRGYSSRNINRFLNGNNKDLLEYKNNYPGYPTNTPESKQQTLEKDTNGELNDYTFNFDFPIMNYSEVLGEHSTYLNRINILSIEPNDNQGDKKLNLYNAFLGAKRLEKKSGRDVLYLGTSSVNADMGTRSMVDKEFKEFDLFSSFELGFDNFLLGNQFLYKKTFTNPNYSKIIEEDEESNSNFNSNYISAKTEKKEEETRANLKVKFDNIELKSDSLNIKSNNVYINSSLKNHQNIIWNTYRINDNNELYYANVNPVGILSDEWGDDNQIIFKKLPDGDYQLQNSEYYINIDRLIFYQVLPGLFTDSEIDNIKDIEDLFVRNIHNNDNDDISGIEIENGVHIMKLADYGITELCKLNDKIYYKSNPLLISFVKTSDSNSISPIIKIFIDELVTDNKVRTLNTVSLENILR